MDCDTARLFLPFDRPKGNDLDRSEAAWLHAHLEQCSACNALAMGARRLDQHIGRAMRAVEVPTGLKVRLLEAMTEDRAKVRRRWLKRAGYVAAVAAVLLLMLGGIYLFGSSEPKYIQSADIRAEASHATSSSWPKGAPDFVNYGYLIGDPAVVELPGARSGWLRPAVKVPRLIFVGPRTAPAQADAPEASPKAIVFILEKRYHIETAVGDDDPSYPYKLDVVSDDPNYTYVILYNGSHWREWLKVEATNAE